MSDPHVPPASARARVQAWNATQWLARLARSYVQSSVRDLTLRWEGATTRIVTPDLVPGIAVSLSLSTLILQFDEDGQPVPHPLELDDKSSSEVEAWLLVELLHRGIDRQRFSKTLPYETPNLMSGEEPKYEAQELAGALGELAAAFATASEILLRAAALLGGDGTTLVVWAERMEIGFTVPAGDGDPSGPITIAWPGGSASPGFRVGREHEQGAIFSPDEGSTPAASAERLVQRVAKVRAEALR